MELKIFLEKNAENIISNMDEKFDSHKFISQLLKDYEKDYVELLYAHKKAKGIFRTLHAKIGKYLKENAIDLSIVKNGKVKSDNIKDYESTNQNWRKLC